MNDAAHHLALQRFALLRPHLEDGVPLTVIAQTTAASLGTLRRWARSYRAEGMAGLQRKPRRDVGSRRSVDEQTIALIQGLALSVPRQSIANIHRQVLALIERDGGKPPSYATVWAIVKAIEPAMTILAHQGPKTYADTFDLLHRREAAGPNAVWQAVRRFLSAFQGVDPLRGQLRALHLGEDRRDLSRELIAHLGCLGLTNRQLRFRQARLDIGEDVLDRRDVVLSQGWHLAAIMHSVLTGEAPFEMTRIGCSNHLNDLSYTRQHTMLNCG